MSDARPQAMSQTTPHDTLVGSQFGSRAEAYLTSAVHAGSADLDALVALARGHSEARVLDLGCGGGHVAFNVAAQVRDVVAYDLSAEMLDVVARAARERGLANVTTRQGVAEALPFEDASFDVVLSRFTAHHWSDFRAGLREARRVLKPGGFAGFVDTVCPGVPLLDTFFQSIELLRDCSHVRNYTRGEWEDALAAAGLRTRGSRHFRMRLDFDAWVTRMRTPQVQVQAIRALQQAVSSEVTAYFETDADGSHSIDVVLFDTTPV